MKNEIFCFGYCKNNGKENQEASAGIVLTHEDDHGRTCRREIGIPFGDINMYQADLKSVIIGLLSIRNFAQSSPITITVPTDYAPRMLKYEIEHKKRVYVNVPRKSEECVSQLRECFDKFRIAVVKQDKDNPDVLRAKELAVTALDSNESYDSGTVVD